MSVQAAYYMVERILPQQQPLCAALLELHKGNMMSSDVEFSAFIKVMKPLVIITEDIKAKKWVIIPVVRLVIHKLLESYLKHTSSDLKLEKTMKVAMTVTFATATQGQC